MLSSDVADAQSASLLLLFLKRALPRSCVCLFNKYSTVGSRYDLEHLEFYLVVHHENGQQTLSIRSNVAHLFRFPAFQRLAALQKRLRLGGVAVVLGGGCHSSAQHTEQNLRLRGNHGPHRANVLLSLLVSRSFMCSI